MKTPNKLIKTLFPVGSVHQGRVIAFNYINEALVILPYNLGGIAEHKNLNVGDVANFKVTSYFNEKGDESGWDGIPILTQVITNKNNK